MSSAVFTLPLPSQWISLRDIVVSVDFNFDDVQSADCASCVRVLERREKDLGIGKGKGGREGSVSHFQFSALYLA